MTPLEQWQLINRDTGALGLENASNRAMLAGAIAVSAGVTGLSIGAGIPVLPILGTLSTLYFGGLMVMNPQT